MKILKDLFPVVIVVAILWGVAILSSGCNSKKNFGAVLMHEVYCNSDKSCLDAAQSVCGKYKSVKVYNNKIKFYCHE